MTEQGQSQDGQRVGVRSAGEFNLEMTLLHRMIRIIIDPSYSPHQQAEAAPIELDPPLRLPLPPAYGWMQARDACPV